MSSSTKKQINSGLFWLPIAVFFGSGFIDIAINKQTTPYELLNVGLGEGIKIKDLVQKIITHSERNLEIVHDLSKPTVPTSLFLDCSLVKEKLDWEPKHTLDEGIIKTLNWYKNNIK